jgi:hypothetical protein
MRKFSRKRRKECTVCVMWQKVVTDFKTAMDYDAVRKKNDDISKQLKLALNEVKYELLTPSKYEI